MSFIQDFKAFALKGNVVDMAVGVIIGGAFGKIVTSVVNNIIMRNVEQCLSGLHHFRSFDTNDVVITAFQLRIGQRFGV